MKGGNIRNILKTVSTIILLLLLIIKIDKHRMMNNTSDSVNS